MPAERTAMRQVRDVVRMKSAGISAREIAARIGVAPSTVRLTMKRLEQAGLDEAAVAEVSEAALEARLFSHVGTQQGHRRRIESDFALIHRELKRKHVTLQIQLNEYIKRHPEVPMLALLQSLSRLRAAIVGDDAPDPCRRRQAVRQLCRRHGAGGRRSTEGHGSTRPDLRGGDGSVELQLWRGGVAPVSRTGGGWV